MQGAAFAVWSRPHRATIFEGGPSTCRIQCPVLGWQVTGVHVPARSHPDAAWCWGVPGHRAVNVRLTLALVVYLPTASSSACLA
jgi:hypothetical protein